VVPRFNVAGDPDIETEETVIVSFGARVTVKRLVAAVAARRFSLYVRVSDVPPDGIAAVGGDVGAVVSGV